ncbi:MAG: glycerol-3-phosphate acyltransferase [Ignavibacteria bacterium]
MEYLFSAVIGYLLGSIPSAYLMLKRTKGIDITKTGSGNVGAMNSYEITGSKMTGIIVLLIDALKGLLSVYIPLLLFPINFSNPAIGIIFAVLSHSYNPWLNFKGGRGLASAAGGTLLIFPFITIAWLIIWFVTYFLKKDIILANIVSIILTLIIIFSASDFVFKYTFPKADSLSSLILFSTALLSIIFIKHIDPLKELLSKAKGSGDGKKK